MPTSIPPLFYALGATLCFAYASTIFTEFSRKVSPFWMNSFKAIVALITFSATVFVLRAWTTPSTGTVVALLSSGCVGLMVGDIFMLHAMKDLGTSRMLLIFGLQPFILSAGGTILFGQNFSAMNFLGLVLMLGCLYTISLESYKKHGQWHIQGMLWGLIAISLDAAGILMTRYGFDSTPGIGSPQVNMLRCIGAVFGFFVINAFHARKSEAISFRPVWATFSKKEKYRIILASIGGTYVSLMLYLVAVSRGTLGVISSVTVTGPMFAAIFECLRARKMPSGYLFIAFTFFVCGFIVFSMMV